MTAPKIPLNFFGIPFGLAGLGEAWTAIAHVGHAPSSVGQGILLIAAVAWLVVVGAYLRHALALPSSVPQDLLDPIAAPFAALALITPILLASAGLYPHAETAGRVVTEVFIALTVLLGGWFTGQWIYGAMDLDTFHPGYFLPTVAGGLVASGAAAVVGQHRLAEVLFGFGLVSWIVLESIIRGRLLFRPMLPAPLLPTIAIEIAPAAVASLAWFQINGGRLDSVIDVLAGYGVLMVLAQLRLVPAFVRLPFMPSTWAFTFSWSAVATTTLTWLQLTQVTGYRAWQYVVLATITVFIGAIFVRTLVAVSRHQLLPKPQSAPPAPAVAPPAGEVAATG